MNHVSLVGRLVNDPEIKELENGTARTIITIAIARDYKNSENVVEADFIKVVLWNGIASATKDYCHKGDVVGIRGKIQNRSYETDSGEKKYILEIIADKISFISSVQPKNA